MFDYFASEVATVLEDYGCEVHREPPFFSVATDNASDILVRLYRDDRFGPSERNTISLVVLGEEDSLDEATRQFMRPLEQWYRVASGTDITEIIEKRALRVLFQPIVRLKERSVFGYECLSRGVSRDGTLVSPDALFRKALDHSLLFNLDRVAREHALIEAHRHGVNGHVCINFMPEAIFDPEFCLRTTMKTVESIGIDPARVVFEVVGSETLDDLELFERIVTYCRSGNVKLALDDVGDADTPLPAMARLRPDIIKLDRSLIRGIDTSGENQERFTALRDLARDNGITLLAEGVETAREMSFLTEHEVDLVQGFYFSEPLEEARYEVPAGR